MKKHRLLSAFGLALQLFAAPAGWARAPDMTSDIIARQLRRQGLPCTGPQDATLDAAASRAHETVWILHCREGAYGVTLVPHLGARISPMPGR